MVKGQDHSQCVNPVCGSYKPLTRPSVADNLDVFCFLDTAPGLALSPPAGRLALIRSARRADWERPSVEITGARGIDGAGAGATAIDVAEPVAAGGGARGCPGVPALGVPGSTCAPAAAPAGAVAAVVASAGAFSVEMEVEPPPVPSNLSLRILENMAFESTTSCAISASQFSSVTPSLPNAAFLLLGISPANGPNPAPPKNVVGPPVLYTAVARSAEVCGP